MIQVNQKKFEETLLGLGIVSKDQIEKAKKNSAKNGKSLGENLVLMSQITAEENVKASAIALNSPYVDLSSSKISQDILQKIPKEIAKKNLIVPFGITRDVLNVAMVNPNNVQAIEFAEIKSGMRVNPYMTSINNINRVIDQYQDLSADVAEAFKHSEPEDRVSIKLDKDMADKISGDAPITRAVNTILEYAAKTKASDIHIEPWKSGLKVRLRVDGILQEAMSLPLHTQAAIISRIKILSNLKIDEHRIPQDGRFDISIDKHEVDIRVAISPTVNGEKVVMRLLDKSSGVIELEKLGIRGHTFNILAKAIKSPQGMILSTGPTGSGKTTTLYAILTKINHPGVNIITLEDPVEYQVSGVNQIQVNTNVGLTFASGLRSILRQDPDIIMVGEIRDSETAGLAVQSALTGHLVLSTLHTNSAAGILPRLLDMDIEPFLIASTVSTAMAQRLVRKLCQKCKKPYNASPAQVETINESVGSLLSKFYKETTNAESFDASTSNKDQYKLFEAKGCAECNNTGFLGRIGVYEAFEISPEIEKLVVRHATSSEVQKQAISEGMITMKQDGVLKALEGMTTMEEVIARVSES